MIPNYQLTEENIIKQIDRKPFIYNYKYSNNYNSKEYQKESTILNSLRLGLVVLANDGKYPESVLDVGYGNGDFLQLAKRKIDECSGYDVSDYPVPKGCWKVFNMFDKYHEVITFWDSLEHFEDIYFVKNLRCKIVCISLPWCHWQSNLDDEWFENWKHRKPDEHLWHFNPASMKKFMTSQGYELIVECDIEDLVRKGVDGKPNIYSSAWRKI